MADSNKGPEQNQGLENEQEQNLDVSFPNIGEEEAPAEPPAETDRLEALEARFNERLESQMAAFDNERARWQRTIDQLIQNRAPVNEPKPTPKQDLDFTDLPDPVERPQEFKQALAKRFDQALSQRVDTRLDEFSRQTQTQQGRDQVLDDMWNTFKTKHADLAEKSTTLRGAVLAEQETLRRAGADPVQGMLSDPDGFMDKVANRMRSELGIQAPPAEGNAPPNGRPTTIGSKPNRTGGLAGGSNTLNGKGRGGEAKAAGFLDQLKKSQLNDGLI